VLAALRRCLPRQPSVLPRQPKCRKNRSTIKDRRKAPSSAATVSFSQLRARARALTERSARMVGALFIRWPSRLSDRCFGINKPSLPSFVTARVPGFYLARSGRRPIGNLQLAVPLEDIATAVPDPETVGGKCSAAAEEIAPVHATGAVAEPSGSGLAGSEILQIDGMRDRG
jgi:hypothetical protein